MSNLLPCPFCGSQPVVRYLALAYEKVVISCSLPKGCGMQPSTLETGLSLEAARLQWGQRPHPPGRRASPTKHCPRTGSP